MSAAEDLYTALQPALPAADKLVVVDGDQVHTMAQRMQGAYLYDPRVVFILLWQDPAARLNLTYLGYVKMLAQRGAVAFVVSMRS